MVPAKIPNVKLVTIDKAMEVNPELKKAYDEQPDVHHLIDMAKRLEVFQDILPCTLPEL